MNYYLLTGATGLLGRYLLRDLLLRDHPVAVIVRPSRFETAAQRIDHVIAHWEREWRRWLPRPVVLSGDINQPGLGLESSQRHWLRQNCRTVLHSAASLAFVEEGDEPWRTNVDGLQNLLEFCDEHALREFLHVSSCYVCGLRSGLVLENELNVGQEFGNIYEKSKVAGEELVRQAGHLDSYTIYRPSIIVGDTDTGFSTTFHGFYTPLRLLSALANYVPHDVLFSVNHMENLGLQGHEGKNFIPVQWLSDAMVALMERRDSCGQTYALAAEHAVTADQLKEVFETAVRQFQAPPKVPAGAAEDFGLDSPEIQASLNTYLESFAVYQSYWRDDPRFDMTNTLEVIPDKRPPRLSNADLLKLCKYAIDNQFAWKPVRQSKSDLLARDRFQNWLQRDSDSNSVTGPMSRNGKAHSNGSSASLTIVVTGPGGGTWTISETGAELSCREGHSSSSPVARLNSAAFQELAEGKKSLEESVAEGRLLVAGDATSTELFRAAISRLIKN